MARTRKTAQQDSVASKDQTAPILKWVGGKRQMMYQLLPRVPSEYGKYIEPFFGGGALFFQLKPEKAVIADSNPELINMYEQVASRVTKVIAYLREYEYSEAFFYELRAKEWDKLDPVEAAARMIYLNKTCFNGLYRVNNKGLFNSSFGKYKNPNYCNVDLLKRASADLKKAKLICDDFCVVLSKHAKKGDFIFLDPPYMPISRNADFRRYTKEQFFEDDQRKLADMVRELADKGCYMLLTNSNHELIHDLYKDYIIDVIPTRRSVSCRADTRSGEDIIVTINPEASKTRD